MVTEPLENARTATTDELERANRVASHSIVVNRGLGPTLLVTTGDHSVDASALSALVSASQHLQHFGISTVVATLDSIPAEINTLRFATTYALEDFKALSTQGRPAAYMLGPVLSGHRFELESLSRNTLELMVESIELVRMRGWSQAAGLPAEPKFVRWHKPGSDSIGVIQFHADCDVVAKIGPREVIEAEAEFITKANCKLKQSGSSPLFPDVLAVINEGERAVNVMGALKPAMLVDRVFANEARTALRDDANSALRPFFDTLAAWYIGTSQAERPTVADYLYRGRFHALPVHQDFQDTFLSLVPEMDVGELCGARVRLPDGSSVAGLSAAARWLDEVIDELLPDTGSAMHGDIYLSNVLRRTDGRIALIDPRTVWEGHRRPDEGFGDPVFDLSTLLHGLLPMAAILAAVDQGNTDELFCAAPTLNRDVLDLSGLDLPFQSSAALQAVEAQMLRVPPSGESPDRMRTRLYIGAAASLLGWLKYERSLRTSSAWFATYAYVVWYLSRAKMSFLNLEQGKIDGHSRLQFACR
ncbi:hypothetical protein ACFWU5_27245 [Nocardia sp. NPDC058640]|uniref:hypothetical protein n=1 Tax=Nocardia sp. NPDC058640 TaxID=3346571 RepID=UPI0036660077